MALLDVPATKSGLLALRRQLDFAREGFALLDQKRELLLLELTACSAKAARARRDVQEALARAYAALEEAELTAGSRAVDAAALAVPPGGHRVEISERRLMGLKVPDAVAGACPEPVEGLGPLGARFGTGNTPAALDGAAKEFAEVLPLLARLAGLETAALRLARELKKTQRRCNALSKKVIPDCRQTIAFLASALEERERESFVILKMIRNRMVRAREDAEGGPLSRA